MTIENDLVNNGGTYAKSRLIWANYGEIQPVEVLVISSQDRETVLEQLRLITLKTVH
jgi:hypothetical protein